MSQFVCLAVVGIAYPVAYLIANVPLEVIVAGETLSPVGTVIPTLVTVPDLISLSKARVPPPSGFGTLTRFVPFPAALPKSRYNRAAFSGCSHTIAPAVDDALKRKRVFPAS